MSYTIVFNNELCALLNGFLSEGAQYWFLVKENPECPLSFSLPFVIIIMLNF